MNIPSFSSCQCIFSAHFFVFFLTSMILSLILIGVSIRYFFGSVDFGSSAHAPCFLYTDSHLSRLLSLYGHTLATSTNLTSPFHMGMIHLKRSSLIVLDIHMLISPF